MTLLRSWLLLTVLLSAGCGNYADFTLPPLDSQSSPPGFRWEALPEPVLDRGSAGDWDDVDVLNPSVVRRGDLYFNFYSGYDGATWHTGFATSRDGVQWTKWGKVLSPDRSTWEGGYIAANGSALLLDGQFYYWYQAGTPPRIGLARSPDGREWTKHNRPVLEPGPRGSWDERGVADPYVIQVGGKLYMYYLGQDRARRQRLGVAMSPDGVRWTKRRTDPVMELGPPGSFDEVGLGEPAVWSSHDRYWMLYTGRDRREHRRLGLAVSRDGVHWQRVSGAAVFEGNREWNSKVVCDPSVEPAAHHVRVWYGGGNEARPAENLNGRIGLAILYWEREGGT